MRSRVPALLATVLLAAACGSEESPAIEADAGASTSTTSSTAPTTSTSAPAAPSEPQSLEVTLSGSGSATATLTYDGDQLCVEGRTDDVGAVTAGHVHAGPGGETGPVVVDLGVQTDGDGPFRGCASVGAEGGVVLVDPASYYVDLHTDAEPDGAVQARLG